MTDWEKIPAVGWHVLMETHDHPMPLADLLITERSSRRARSITHRLASYGLVCVEYNRTGRALQMVTHRTSIGREVALRARSARLPLGAIPWAAWAALAAQTKGEPMRKAVARYHQTIETLGIGSRIGADYSDGIEPTDIGAAIMAHHIEHHRARDAQLAAK